MVSALGDSRSIPKIDSRLLMASRDPPIGTPIQKVGGSSTEYPRYVAEKKPSRMVCIPSAFAAFKFLESRGSEFRDINGGCSQRGR